jgi:hypothetical protein
MILYNEIGWGENVKIFDKTLLENQYNVYPNQEKMTIKSPPFTKRFPIVSIKPPVIERLNRNQSEVYMI